MGGGFRRRPTGENRKLIPVRVRECAPGGILGSIVYEDFVGVNEPRRANASNGCWTISPANEASLNEPRDFRDSQSHFRVERKLFRPRHNLLPQGLAWARYRRNPLLASLAFIAAPSSRFWASTWSPRPARCHSAGATRNSSASTIGYSTTAAPRMVVTSPAGRGKTAMLVQWLKLLQARGHVGEAGWWLAFMPISIRAGTNKPGVFLGGLAHRLAEWQAGSARRRTKSRRPQICCAGPDRGDRRGPAPPARA